LGGSSSNIAFHSSRLSSLCMDWPWSALRSHYPWHRSRLHHRCMLHSSSMLLLHPRCPATSHGTSSHWQSGSSVPVRWITPRLILVTPLSFNHLIPLYLHLSLLATDPFCLSSQKVTRFSIDHFILIMFLLHLTSLRIFFSFVNIPLTIGVKWNLTLLAYLWRILLPGMWSLGVIALGHCTRSVLLPRILLRRPHTTPSLLLLTPHRSSIIISVILARTLCWSSLLVVI
jgi:hypothetical protein